MSVLRQTLRTLPPTLDETYDRILLSIPPEYHHEAYTALRFLAVARCSVSVADVAEAVAINQECHTFDPCDRLTDPFDIIEILSSLVTHSSGQILLRSSQVPRYGSFPGAERATEIRLAHYSVKEYLLSDRICHGKASTFHLMLHEAHRSAAELCLTYLLSFDQPDSITAELLLDYPFGLYAAQFWHEHAQTFCSSSKHEKNGEVSLTQLAIRLLNPQQKSCYINWLRLCDPSEPWQGVDDKRVLKSMAAPLFYACYTGLIEVVRELLDQGADLNYHQGLGRLVTPTPLNGSILGGHAPMVKFLLDSGVQVNAIGDWGRTSLHHAALNGKDFIVELLVQHGALLECRTGPMIPYDLVDAPSEDPLRTLMDSRVTGRSPREEIAIALLHHLLETQRHLESVSFRINPVNQWPKHGNVSSLLKTLMYGGYERETCSATGWTPLHESSWGGHVGVVRLLLKQGADIEAKTRYGWTALLFATWEGHTSIVAELIEWGADVSVKNVYGWTPLHAARKESIIHLLLDMGADIDARTSYGWTSLFGMSNFDDNATALLIQRGGDLNAYNLYFGTALHMAAKANIVTSVQCLRVSVWNHSFRRSSSTGTR